MARRMIRCVGAASIIVPVLLLTVTPVLSAPRSATQPEAAMFNIFGHVITPGSYAWSEGITVKQGGRARGRIRQLWIEV